MLATNIAETSLTIDGVKIVVDAGLERRNAFDPASGMSRLETQRISRASAEQRAGRAGRTSPGVCYRLWGEGGERSLAPFAPPEIATADLAPLALDLAVWGTPATQLRWLDPPPAATLASARDLLVRLGALDAAGRATRHGLAMHELAAHPRLAHMLLAAREHGAGAAAAELAALLSERDVLRGGTLGPGGNRERDTDIRTRLDALRRGSGRGPLERVRRAEQSFRRELSVPASARAIDSPLATGVLLAFAYPDRIGKRRPGDAPRYTLANGRGASFGNPESIAREEFIVALELDDRDRDAKILLAAPLARADLLDRVRRAARAARRSHVGRAHGGRRRAPHAAARRARRRRQAAAGDSSRGRCCRVRRRPALARRRRPAVGRRQPRLRGARRVRACARSAAISPTGPTSPRRRCSRT